ncbi:Vacuolar ATPase assembly integral membrane protein VMA21 [Ceratocystis fimbriata CBS 114723]|uniref:Vacuolar ATPase assembly integral membrane protein VMA21 n=1 Tax=Ceratocystis fimbriata CBS 114723 TaxID=1035309 RepID=A0A2C5XB73_9PEZI|nr:Vacuolar ATPase assembly integral membrane protein VMA21 [Ceratocystis fimbriata CBS 114723]
MATRRITSSEKTFLDQDDTSALAKSDTAPAVPKQVIMKLMGFTLAMIICPIGSYFLTVNSVFKGNSSYAGGLAAIIANFVLIAYVIVAMREDQSEQHSEKKEGKKDQ